MNLLEQMRIKKNTASLERISGKIYLLLRDVTDARLTKELNEILEKVLALEPVPDADAIKTENKIVELLNEIKTKLRQGVSADKIIPLTEEIGLLLLERNG